LIAYRKATVDDIIPALNLALRVFMEYEAPDCPPEGADYYLTRLKKKNSTA
jgi:hypothetical protein